MPIRVKEGIITLLIFIPIMLFIGHLQKHDELKRKENLKKQGYSVHQADSIVSKEIKEEQNERMWWLLLY